MTTKSRTDQQFCSERDPEAPLVTNNLKQTWDANDELRSDRQAAFVREYVKDCNATQAAIRAGYSERTAQEQSSRLLSNVMVKAAIERRLAQIAAIAEVDAALVVRELLDAATADPRDLVQVTRDCCRYCYGINNQRQWTQGEYDRALAEALASRTPAPGLAGGTGYNATREPLEECPECFGRGVESVIVTDTRKLSGKAAKLYAGAQQTKDGVKSISRDQNAALMALGRYLGIFKERTEVSGPAGAPVPLLGLRPADLSDAQLAAIVAAGAGQLIGGLSE